MKRSWHWLVALSVLLGCGRYRPALFADRPAVQLVHDDKPIPLPSRQDFNEGAHLSDVYLRRPLFDVVRPVDFATGGDVNAFDEVPPSSWFDPTLTRPPAPGDRVPEPPAFPLVAIDEAPVTNDAALVVRDARGLRYELLSDPIDKAGLLSGAEVLGAHLLRRIGIRAARSWILGVPDATIRVQGSEGHERFLAWLTRKVARVEGCRRVSATLWPDGIDVGIASDYQARSDDPNDNVDHHDRRTLRAMRIFAQWMGWTAFGVRSTRDLYVGRPGEGHLAHYVLGTSHAFGTEDIQDKDLPDEEAGSIGWHLVTLGLSRPRTSLARRAPYPSLGYFPPFVIPGAFDVSPPYSPFVRLTPADEYWAGKRLIDAGDDALRIGVNAATLPHEAARHLTDALKERRRMLIAHAMSVVSPLDLAASVGRSLWLRDRAIAAGASETQGTVYEVSFIDGDGTELAPGLRIAAAGELSVVRLPVKLLVGLVVLRVRVVRAGVPAPRTVDIHVMASAQAARVIGIRH